MTKPSSAGMSILVRTAARLTVGFMLLYGIYIASHGHIFPGGGFVGGILIALSFINILLAYGKDLALAKVPDPVLAFFENLGALVFLSAVLLAFTVGYFIIYGLGGTNPSPAWEAARAAFSYLEVVLKVGAGIFAIFIAFVLLRAGSGAKI